MNTMRYVRSFSRSLINAVDLSTRVSITLFYILFYFIFVMIAIVNYYFNRSIRLIKENTV